MGLQFSVAQSLEEVVEAWGLVYYSYLRSHLIKPNPSRIHTVPQAVLADQSVVICGKIEGLTVSTMSAYHDGEHRLPLDSVYAEELDELRASGRRLVEIGLFADRREKLHRSLEALLELMRWATYFGVHGGATDAIIGVHPHHAAFYTRLLGFEAIGPTRSYSTVNGAPVTLLRLDWYERIALPCPPRGLAHVLAAPLTADDFTHRYIPHMDELETSPVADYLASHGWLTQRPPMHLKSA